MWAKFRSALVRYLAASENGSVLVIVALWMVVLLGFMGLAIDVGYLRCVKREMRSAADAAAVGGAEALLYRNNTGGVAGAGKADAAKDGFSNGVNGVTVNVYSPPNDGPHSCAKDVNCAQYVEATISQGEPTFFMRMFSIHSVTISARAVAWAGASNTGCVYALDPSASNAFVISGGASVAAPQCVMYVDSNNPTAAYVASGGGCDTTVQIGVVGAYQWDGVCTKPRSGMAPVSDPLASRQPPSAGSCPALPPPVPAGCTYSASNGLQCNSTPSASLQPGTYCNGITVSGSHTTVTLTAGTYVLNGGGLNLAGGANVIGNGVTFYNTVSATTTYKPIAFSGGSSSSLTAPSSGSLAGILFFQDRSLPSGDLNQSNTISGGSGMVMQGTLYFPTTPLVISGGSSLQPLSLTVALVADTVTVSGGSKVTIASFPSGQNPIHQVALVE